MSTKGTTGLTIGCVLLAVTILIPAVAWAQSSDSVPSVPIAEATASESVDAGSSDGTAEEDLNDSLASLLGDGLYSPFGPPPQKSFASPSDP
jgi:hypothetical protein